MASKASKSNNVAGIKIAHIADNHLRQSQYGNKERGQDFNASFRDSLRVAVEAGVDLICQVGDILDCTKPPAEVVRQLIEADRYLRENNMLCLCVTGNHDWSTPLWTEVIGRRYDGNIPDNATGIVPIDGQVVTFKGVTFYGLPQMSPRQFELKKMELKLDGVDVILFHGIVDDIVPIYTGGEFHIKPDDFKVPLTLLGDLHAQNYITNKHGGLIGYCGATESTKADEPTTSSVPIIQYPEPKVLERLPVKRRAMLDRTIIESGGFDDLITEIRELDRPVVIVKHVRELTQEAARLWALNKPGMLLRVRALPADKVSAVRSEDTGEHHDLRWFVAARLNDNEELAALADDLVQRDDDAFNIISKFIEQREKAL